MRLKRILRDNGISWSPIAQSHMQQSNPLKRKTRSSMTAQELGHPYLPMEVILRILKFAMKSSEPIVDPLSPLTPGNLSDKEKTQGNQIAITLLSQLLKLSVALPIFPPNSDKVSLMSTSVSSHDTMMINLVVDISLIAAITLI
jgi:hypothetical protein